MADSKAPGQSGTGSTRDSFLPTADVVSLRWRAALLSELRRFFEEQGYCEVETPILSRDVLVDAYIEPFSTRWNRDAVAQADKRDAVGDELFLQTSPEFGMKRLLAAGMPAIYQVTRAFRNGEHGRYHNPEFTMVEWYRRGDSHVEQMQFVESLVARIFDSAPLLRPPHAEPHPPIGSPQPQTSSHDSSRAVAGVESADGERRECPAVSDTAGSESTQGESRAVLPRPFARLSYDEAFETYAGQRVLGCSTRQLRELAAAHQRVPPAGLDEEDRDGWLNWLLAELIEPHLGSTRPVFLYDYPASQPALARIRHDNPPVAERFELYIQGVEICNGYQELVDAEEFQARIARQAALRERHGYRSLPGRNRLMEAMHAGLPDSAGVALGFDRLVMLATGAASLADVIAFPFERA